MASTIETYEEFWPYYVSEHRDATNRRLHFAGTSLVMAMAFNPLLWPLMPVAGYGFSWLGHFKFERNRPAAFSYPGWSLRADFRMWRKIAMGKMDDELSRAEALYPASAGP